MEPKFKVGDKVKVTWKMSSDSRLYNGSITTVKSFEPQISQYGNYSYILNNITDPGGVWESELELVQPEVIKTAYTFTPPNSKSGIS